MSDPVRIGVAGLTHGHVWGLIDAFKLHPDVTLVAVAEADPIRERATPDLATPYADWERMLDVEPLDGLIVTSDNKTSSAIAVAALSAGIPCLVEKAMARNAADADKMLSAARHSGKALMINWPLAWNPWLHDLKRRIDGGDIGHVFHTKFRNGHSGPKEIGCGPEFYNWLYDEELNGGGAIADFCSYGAVLCRWFYGMPESVYCIRGNFTKEYSTPDDHAVCVLRYPKASAIVEGTWATKGFDASGNPVIHGSDGTLSVFGGKVHINQGRDEAIVEPPKVSPADPASYFVECIRGSRVPEGILDPTIAADACRIIDAAKRSNVSGCAETP
ncbi:MAG: Gfo/Idh/MocA family protein [Fimbriimonadaceae bacterium]